MPDGDDPQSCAVAYLRRSTDRQERSLDDQLTAIRTYANAHALLVSRIYTDDAISGVRSDTRRAFQAMIRDAQQSDCGFRTILVYDIKRFGRVDNDEAGHYRWLLRQAGVRVVYIAEGFGGGSIDDLIRPVKQWQAREEARDLARVSIRGMVSKIRGDQSLGLWLGGFPPHGYDLRYESGDGRFRFVVRYMRDGTRQLLDENGQLVARLKRREPAVITKSDRCRLVPSSPNRVKVICRIFQ
jgi:DNA invertase Pin-like site-specific DNA recombinase